MQNHFPPRRNIDTLISSIRNMANNTCKEVSSNPQDPASIPQPIESRTSIQSERAQPTAPAGTQMAAMLRSIGVANPEIGTLVEGIHKVHAKVDQVIRFLPTDSKNQLSVHSTNENYQTVNSQHSERTHEVHSQEPAPVRSLNELNFPNVPSLQDFSSAEPMSNMTSIRNAISTRPMAFSQPFQPSYAQQYNMNNVFPKNGGTPIPYPFPNDMPMSQSHLNTVNPNEYESTLIKMIPLECDPVIPQYTSHAAQQVPSTGSIQPSNYNLYPNRSLNEVQEPREQVEHDRPKSLLYTSNYTKASQNKPKSQLQYPPASVVQKNKLNLPEKKSNLGSIQNFEGNSEASGYFEAEQEDYYGLKNGKGPYGSRRGSGLKEVSQNQYVENIMRKIKTQENNYKQMQAEKQVAHGKTGLETGGNAQIQNENSYKEDPSIHYGYVNSMNNISERSSQINSMQEIGKRLGQLGKEAKSKQKRAVPSLGGGNLVYEKKENPLQTNVQVFGKEVRSGRHMGTLMAKRTSSGNIRNIDSKEFVRKDPNQRKPQPEFIKKTGNMKENYNNRHYNEPSYEEEDDYVEEGDYENEEEDEYDEEEEEESYYEEDDEDYDVEQRGSGRYYGGESERKSRRPAQEEQDMENTELQRSEFIIRDGRSRVENGEMVWSSHKKQRLVGYMH